MSPADTDLILKFLIDRLDPDAKAELQQLLGGGDLPDVAEDIRAGRLSMDRMPERMKRVMASKVRTSPERIAQDAAARAAYAERFPHADRLR